MLSLPSSFFFFFFNDTATTEIYTLSLHDALPISTLPKWTDWTTTKVKPESKRKFDGYLRKMIAAYKSADRKSTRLNSSHSQISYAVFCLKKKKNKLIVCCKCTPDRSYVNQVVADA